MRVLIVFGLEKGRFLVRLLERGHMTMGRLDGKVALITGAARGMGEAEARLFAQEGARVVIADVLDAEGQVLAKDLGDSARYCHLDVTSEEGWTATVELATSEFGRLDILVNNAGILRMSPLAMTTLDDYMAVINVNQVGVFLGMKAATPAMAANGSGSIVNISSIDGLVGMAGGVAYVASKFAVRGMTKVAALELGSLGIRVNSIHPGGVDTPMIRIEGFEPGVVEEMMSQQVPLGRIAQPIEIGRLALFLASEESSYCTGSEFVADGGMTAGFGLPGS